LADHPSNEPFMHNQDFIGHLLGEFARTDLSDASYARLEAAAGILLKDVRLVVFGAPCRILEIELYLHADQHRDPFTHRHAVQQSFGRWYVHRSGQGYRNGSFKGLDVTIGSDGHFGGLLIRSIRTAEGATINGPCVTVDHLLKSGGLHGPRDLDVTVGSKDVWDSDNPVRLERGASLDAEVYRSARVGLTLKKCLPHDQPDKFILRNYRFLVEPRTIRKGTPHLVAALLGQGVAVQQIHRVTGCPVKTIQGYANWMREGEHLSIADFYGNAMETADFCRLSAALGPCR
jgi:3-methyladenine DNA glycosylase Mpg